MTDYTMILSFDIDQISRALKYKFVGPDTTDVFPQPAGKTAGSYNFLQGDRLRTKVVATDEDPNRKFGIKSAECTFVFVNRRIGGGRNPNLSPFAHNRACINLGPVDKLPIDEAPDDKLVLSEKVGKASGILMSKYHKVESRNGSWATSGYLTVTFWVDADAEQNSRTRLFIFDPETSAGDGGPGGN